MGFANEILGGAAALIRAAIKSPNYVAGSTGWTINKDGSAEFNNVTIRGGQVISGTALYYSGPPALGNLVASVSAAPGTDPFGNAYLAGIVAYLDVGGVTPFQAVVLNGQRLYFYGANAAGGPWTWRGNMWMPGAGTALQLAFPQVVIQDTNSSDITIGGSVTLDSLNSQVILSNGTPYTITFSTADAHPVFGGPIELKDASAPSTPTTGVKPYSSSGYQHYVAEDGADYSTGHLVAHASNGSLGQTVNSTGFTAINGMSVAVGTGIYQFLIEVDLTTAAAAGQWELALATTGVTSTTDYKFFWESGAGATAGAVHQTSITTVQKGPNPSVIGPYTARYKGIVRFTSAGTFSVTAATTVAADTFTVWDGSTMELIPFG